jgi:hypothetical protein
MALPRLRDDTLNSWKVSQIGFRPEWNAQGYRGSFGTGFVDGICKASGN